MRRPSGALPPPYIQLWGTHMMLAQLAVVRTHHSFRMEPEQKWDRENCSDTTQGNSPSSASQQLGHRAAKPGRIPHPAVQEKGQARLSLGAGHPTLTPASGATVEG